MLVTVLGLFFWASLAANIGRTAPTLSRDSQVYIASAIMLIIIVITWLGNKALWGIRGVSRLLVNVATFGIFVTLNIAIEFISLLLDLGIGSVLR